MKVKIKGVLAIMLLASAGLYGQLESAKEIRVVSAWGGLGKPSTDKLTIVRNGEDYYVKGKKIDSELIRNFFEALNEPAILAPDPVNLGITQEWLNANAESGVREYASFYFDTGAPNQKELYYSTFKDIGAIARLLPRILDGGWTDDYPYVRVEILWANGLRTLVSSHEQPLFMLPWQIDRDGKTTETYNANISRSLAALLPRKLTNRNRIVGEGLARVLATTVMRHIEKDWKRLEAENKAAVPLAALKESYQVVSTEINPYHDSDYGRAWNNYKNFETNLHVVLRKKDFPEGFAIKLILPFQDGKAGNLNLFLRNISEYQRSLESVSWLWQHIRSDGRSVWLRFVKNRSFSEKGMASFRADMEKLGRQDIADEVEKVQDKVVLISVGGGLEYYQTFWLILPDGKVILWRDYYGNLLKWKKTDFEAKECAEARSNTQPCIGAVISPDGSIIPK